MSESLLFEEPIIYMHADLDPYAAMSVGFNNNRQLVIELRYDRQNDYHPYSYTKRIIVDGIGADRLIKKLHTCLTQLPKAFAKEFGINGESWSTSEVFDIYNEILNYLSCLNIHYQIDKEEK